MQRYKITIEYDGSKFVGWQSQKNGLGVQKAIESAIKEFCDEDVKVLGSGRTDAGVHALAQVAHFDIKKKTSSDVVRDALNHHLKKGTASIINVEAVDSNFHSRFSAKQRAYLYRIVNRRAPLSLDTGRVWWVPVKLDVIRMHEASQVLIGRHDFTTFRAAECQADGPIKTLDAINVECLDYPGGVEIRVNVRAKSFLYHQVRNIVGSLKLVGQGRWSVEEFKNVLKAADRTKGGPTAPSEGLYFVETVY